MKLTKRYKQVIWGILILVFIGVYWFGFLPHIWNWTTNDCGEWKRVLGCGYCGYIEDKYAHSWTNVICPNCGTSSKGNIGWKDYQGTARYTFWHGWETKGKFEPLMMESK